MIYREFGKKERKEEFVREQVSSLSKSIYYFDIDKIIRYNDDIGVGFKHTSFCASGVHNLCKKVKLRSHHFFA